MVTMVAMRETVTAAQTELRARTKGPVDLARPLGLLSGVLSSLAEDGHEPILLAKKACESIADCASEADNAGDHDAAECFRNVVRALSPVVAGCFPLPS